MDELTAASAASIATLPPHQAQRPYPTHARAPADRRRVGPPSREERGSGGGEARGSPPLRDASRGSSPDDRTDTLSLPIPANTGTGAPTAQQTSSGKAHRARFAPPAPLEPERANSPRVGPKSPGEESLTGTASSTPAAVQSTVVALPPAVAVSAEEEGAPVGSTAGRAVQRYSPLPMPTLPAEMTAPRRVGAALFDTASEAVGTLEQQYRATVKQLDAVQGLYGRLNRHNDVLGEQLNTLLGQMDGVKQTLAYRVYNEMRRTKTEVRALRQHVELILCDFGQYLTAMTAEVSRSVEDAIGEATGESALLPYYAVSENRARATAASLAAAAGPRPLYRPESWLASLSPRRPPQVPLLTDGAVLPAPLAAPIDRLTPPQLQGEPQQQQPPLTLTSAVWCLGSNGPAEIANTRQPLVDAEAGDVDAGVALAAARQHVAALEEQLRAREEACERRVQRLKDAHRAKEATWVGELLLLRRALNMPTDDLDAVAVPTRITPRGQPQSSRYGSVLPTVDDDIDSSNSDERARALVPYSAGGASRTLPYSGGSQSCESIRDVGNDDDDDDDADGNNNNNSNGFSRRPGRNPRYPVYRYADGGNNSVADEADAFEQDSDGSSLSYSPPQHRGHQYHRRHHHHHRGSGSGRVRDSVYIGGRDSDAASTGSDSADDDGGDQQAAWSDARKGAQPVDSSRLGEESEGVGWRHQHAEGGGRLISFAMSRGAGGGRSSKADQTRLESAARKLLDAVQAGKRGAEPSAGERASSSRQRSARMEHAATTAPPRPRRRVPPEEEARQLKRMLASRTLVPSGRLTRAVAPSDVSKVTQGLWAEQLLSQRGLA